MLSYPIWLLIFAILPTFSILVWKRKVFRKYTKILYLALIGGLLFAFPWDLIAIHERIWYFTTPHIFGIYLAGLPIEEWVFIAVETLLFTEITVLFWDRRNK